MVNNFIIEIFSGNGLEATWKKILLTRKTPAINSLEISLTKQNKTKLSQLQKVQKILKELK